MQRRLLGLIWSLLPPLVGADELKITINDVPDDNGSIMISVLENEAAFNDKAPDTASMILPAQKGSVSLTLHDLAPGQYGVRVMHDQNGNMKLDSNLVGMPTEPWGFSNNAMGRFGPPGWKDVTFEHSGYTDVTINLNH